MLVLLFYSTEQAETAPVNHFVKARNVQTSFEGYAVLPDIKQKIMKDLFPLISCTCVTSNRPEMLQQAVACFEAQTYPEKELVILYRVTDHATHALRYRLQLNRQIKMIAVPDHKQLSLGEMRNTAISHASGAYICQWDDDDWYHPERLAIQYQRMKEAGASGVVLDHILMYDALKQNAYLSCKRLWEGSLLCRKEDMLRAGYEARDKGEDSKLVYSLYAEGLLHSVPDEPSLYIYNYHGVNTWDHQHFKGFYRHSRLLADVCAGEIRKIVSHYYAPQHAVSKLDCIFQNTYQ